MMRSWKCKCICSVNICKFLENTCRIHEIQTVLIMPAQPCNSFIPQPNRSSGIPSYRIRIESLGTRYHYRSHHSVCVLSYAKMIVSRDI
ncbi:hypothetical protein MPTK2_2g90030P [Marchantia polymorpha subsp. ruderalis]